MLRHFRLTFNALALLLFFSPSVHATPSLWFSDADTLYQADLASYTHTRSFSIKARALSPDALGGTWVLTSTELIRLDPEGVSQLVKTRDSLTLNGDVVLAADPWDGTLWLATNKTLLHINAAGDILLRLTPQRKEDADTVDMAVGLDQSVWQLTKKSVRRYSSTGVMLVEVPLASLLEGDARHLALDPLNPIVWIAAGDDDNEDVNENDDGKGKEEASQPRTLLRLDFSGKSMTTLSVAAPRLRDIAFTPQNGDPQSGRLWALSTHTLSRYRTDGAVEATVDLKALNLTSPRRLTLAPGSGTPWIGHSKSVTALSYEGVLLASFVTEKTLNYADATLLRVTPTLGLVSPPVSFITNNTMPIFILDYGANCNGLPCRLGSSQWAGYQLASTFNDLAISDRFTFNAATGQAVWTLTTPLAEGIYRFSSQVHDVFGHASNTVASTITIDTTPPSFLELLPQNGTSFSDASSTNSFNISVSGRLSEPGLISLGRSIKQGPDFSFPVTLLPGPNTLSLFGIDEAGNSSSQTLKYSYNQVKFTISSPAAGTTINDDNVLVTGTSTQGLMNTGITVNGVIATQYGNSFYAQVPLRTGANTLNITATTITGGTSTQTLNVDSSGPAPLQLRTSTMSGVAPLTVIFTLQNNTGNAITQIAADFNGDGVPDFTTADPAAAMQYVYTTPGVYQANIKITDINNVTVEKTAVVVVQDAVQIDQVLKTQWSNLTNALVSGDKQKAMTYLSDHAQLKYGPVFDILIPDFPKILPTWSPLLKSNVSGEMAEYGVVTNNGKKRQLFYLYFILGGDGVWRLDSM